MKTLFNVLTAMLLLTAFAHADPWTGEGELGFVLVSGNTESETLNAAMKVEKIHTKWKHISKLSAIHSESDDVVSSESYSASWRSEYSLSERGFTYGDFRYFDDKFDSFEGIYTASLGLGYDVIKTEQILWALSAGVGYRDTTIELTQENISGETYVTESNFKWVMTETTILENNIRAEFTADNNFVQTVTGFSVSINHSLALKLAYDVRYNSEPSPDFESTDRIFSTNIVFSF